MSAVQFFLPYQTATYNGIAQPGAKLKFYTTGTTTPLAIYSNSGLSVAASNPVVANGSGQFPTFYLDSTKTYRLVITDKNDASLGVDIDPYIPGTIPDASVLTPYTDSATASAASATSSASAASTSATAASTSASAASTSATNAASSASTASAAATAASTSISAVPNATAHAATRTALSALGSSSGPAYLHESGREGTFVWSSSNLSTNVTNDPNQGVYVAPASAPTGASGAWVRVVSGGVYCPEWFGAKGDNTTIDYSAINAALTFLYSIGNASYTVIASGTGLPELRFGAKSYYLGGNALDIYGTIRLRGGASGDASGSATVLRWDAGTDGIRFQYYQTSGQRTKDVSILKQSTGSMMEGFWLEGGFVDGTSTPEGEYHAIVMRARASLKDVYAHKWQGDGFWIHAAVVGADGADPPYGNASNFKVVNCRASGTRDGLNIKGGDTNAAYSLGFQASGCRRHGINDQSFLGNLHQAPLAENCSITTQNDGVVIACTVVSDGTNRFFVNNGQSAGASTNAPPATATDNTYWIYAGAGAAQSGIPTWVSGILVREGYPYYTTNAAAQHVVSNPYSEGGQAASYYSTGTLVLGGLIGQNSGSTLAGQGIFKNVTGVLSGFTGLRSLAYDGTTSTFWTKLGETSLQTVYCYRDPSGANTWRLRVNGSNDTIFDYANVNVAYTVSGPGTALQFGTGANQPYCFFSNNLRVGNGNNARLINTANTAPASGTLAKGSIFLNYNYAGPTNVMAWMSNSTGGFTTDVLVSGLNAYGVGYVTGAGGTVTQGTSKSTGVTLNKLSGQVTMNAAALASATKVSFVVTNSQVAATDVVLVNVASGGTANAYRADTTAVAAGSFTVTVENITAGSLSEAPVITFAVIKAVTA